MDPQQVKLVTAPPSGDRLKLSVPVSTTWRVDAEAGELRNVSLMTGDREATGHGLYIDQRTLDTGLESVAARGGKLKVGIRHPTMADWWSRNMDRAIDVPGWYSDIAIRGNQLVAGRTQFYDTFKTQQADAFARLMEMAAKTPELFGLSIEAWGYGVYVDEAGNEYFEKPAADAEGEEIPLRYHGVPAFRITDLSAAAFVDEPAANAGLFAAFGRKFERLFNTEKREQFATLREIAEGFLTFAAQNGFPSAPVSEDPGANAHHHETNLDPEMSKLATIREKFGADQKRLARAFALLAANGELTVEQIETELNKKPAPAAQPTGEENTFSAVVAHFKDDQPRLQAALGILAATPDATLATIEAELAQADAAEGDRLRKENETLRQRAEKAEKDFKDLKESGHLGVRTGIAASNGAAPGGEQKRVSGRSRLAAAFSEQSAVAAAMESRN